MILNDKEIDATGPFKARCSVCLTDKSDCQPISYPQIVEIYKHFKVAANAYAVCKDCCDRAKNGSDEDKRFLHRNIMDYFITNELWRWSCGKKDGIVRDNEEFQSLLKFAVDNKVLYREDKFIRNHQIKESGFINSLWSNQYNKDYTPNILYQSLFNKLYNN